MSDLDPTPPADGRTVGAAVAPLLAAYGVDVVFGIPGVHNVELYRGLSATPIRHVLARHEQGAGFMADGYARLSGRPGVSFVISGPGLTNVATPMGQAYSDSIPMLVLGAVRARSDLNAERGHLHEISNQLAVAQPLTGFCQTVLDASALPALVHGAFSSLSASRPRPSFIEIPLDVLVEPTAQGWFAQPLPSPPPPAPAAVRRAAELLAKAERPVMLVGGGAIGASEPLRRLSDRHGIAVLPTIAGKGVVPDHHPLSVNATLPSSATLAWLAEADVVLAIGTELAPTDSWQPLLPLRGHLIRVDLAVENMTGDYPPTVAIEADAAVVAAALLEEMGSGGSRSPSWRENREREVASVVSAIGTGRSEEESLHAAVIDLLQSALPEDAAVYTDMTRIAYSGNECFQADQPRTWFHPVGYGTLGYAVPAAIGGCFAGTGRPVVALAGDYGFGYTAQELLVASEHRLGLPVLIWNSENLGAIEADMRRKNIPPIAVDALNPSFERLAQAYHCEYCRPGAAGELSAALSDAFSVDRPTLIELEVETARGWFAQG